MNTYRSQDIFISYSVICVLFVPKCQSCVFISEKH